MSVDDVSQRSVHGAAHERMKAAIKDQKCPEFVRGFLVKQYSARSEIPEEIVDELRAASIEV